MPPKVLSQADKRRDTNLTDQFGRRWLAAIDRDTWEPVGHISPAWSVADDAVSDPLHTPQQYLRVLRDDHGNPQINRLDIDIDRWIRDQETATKEWKTRLWNIGRDMQKNAFNPKTAEEDEYLLHLTGPRPWPSPAVLLRARKGDKRLLGIDPMDRDTRILLGIVELEDLEAAANESEPKMLAHQAGEPENEEELAEQKKALMGKGGVLDTGDFKQFMSACLEKGITMKQAGKLWKEFKGALKEA